APERGQRERALASDVRGAEVVPGGKVEEGLLELEEPGLALPLVLGAEDVVRDAQRVYVGVVREEPAVEAVDSALAEGSPVPHGPKEPQDPVPRVVAEFVVEPAGAHLDEEIA